MVEYDVELRSVTKRFGEVVAVDNVSLAVKKGEFLSILGPSGCGKTTTLRLIGGFEKPDSGEIYIGGRSMRDIPPYERNVNTVFQNYALFPHMRVYDNIAFGLRMKKVRESEIKERVKAALELVKLSGFEKRYPKQLSGGEQQRVALARALVNNPEVLLLDEPLGSLDQKLRKQMQIELKNIQTKLGITFIYVTHDQEEALTMSDRIAIMNKGRIEQVGNADDIYEKPRTRFVADFIGETNLLQGEVLAINGKKAVIQCNGLVYEIAAEESCREGEMLWISIRPEKIQIGQDLKLDNVFNGIVRSEVYKGSITKYEVLVEDRIPLVVEMQNVNKFPYRKGDRVKVGWSAESCCLLKE
ncbi:MAG: ABC transporter ATP-binding protein [Methanocellales archaeon]